MYMTCRNNDPDPTQVSLFRLRNRECGKQLNISWNGVNLTHCNLPVYLGITLDRTLSYKAHIEKTKKKVGTRNNMIRKRRTSKWGATSTTLMSSALELCYSCAEYACPVWERSTMQRSWTRHWIKPVEWSQDVWSRQILTVCPNTPESPHHTSGERWQVVLNGHGKPRTKRTHSMDISEWCHASNRGRALWHALSPSTRRWKLPAWSYGENDSGPWTPKCILTSVLTNTSQLAQRIPGQPGRHSTGCIHRLGGQEWTCLSGDFPTNKKPVTVASGRPCNTYWSAPWWALPGLP